MKKPKQQKSTVPVSVSAKKSSTLNHELFFTPYKIQWKNVQPPGSGQTSSRTFFNTMKNDLSNLKNDVERMIKKQVYKNDYKHQKIGILEDSSNNKNKQETKFNSTNQKIKNLQNSKEQNLVPVFQIQNITIQQESSSKVESSKLIKLLKEKQSYIETVSKQTKIEKNLITQLKRQNQQLYSQIQQNLNNQTKLKNQLKQLEQIRSQQIQTYKNQIQKFQQKIRELQEYNKSLISKNCQLLKMFERLNNEGEQETIQLKKINEQIKSHNAFLQQKIQCLSEKMSLVSGKFQEKVIYIRQLEAKLESFKIQKKEYQIQQEEQKKKLICQWQQIIKNRQKQSHMRIQFQLKKCQKQFIQQIQQIQQRTRQAVQNLEEQNLQFCNKIKQLQQQINKNKQQSLLLPTNFISIASQTQNYQSNLIQCKQKIQLNKTPQIDFSRLGFQFQKKINQLILQNYLLKNRITALESDFESMAACKNALEQQIKLFQEIKAEQNVNKNSNSNEWEKALFQIHNLKKQKDQIIQQFQFKIIKLENQLEQQKNKVNKFQHSNQPVITSGINFNKILKQQLQQNQDLKQKMRQQTRQLHNLQILLKENQQKQLLFNQELSIQKIKTHLLQKKCKAHQQKSQNYYTQDAVNSLKYDLDLLTKKYQTLNTTLQSKNKQIKGKDQLIERVLISKIGKKEDQDQIAFILKEIKNFYNNS